MECMAETVSDSRYQSLHHMLSESDWDRRAVRLQRVIDANAQRSGCRLVSAGNVGQRCDPLRGGGVPEAMLLN